MTLHTVRNTAISLSLAAAVLSAAAAHAQQSNSPYGNQQPSAYPAQQPNAYPNGGQQSPYPNQQNGYPNSAQQPNPDRDRHDADRDRHDRDQTTEGPHNWTTDQIITATVHQAWVLSGQNEANFFAIVRELAEISAHNRNLALPDDPAAGRRAGEYIKEQARADHDQLLYDIVDKSVRMTGRPMTESPGR
jgi:hypothetical protein